jgi:prepilin-type N-terminal cleavage/methylation domain-containing protein
MKTSRGFTLIEVIITLTVMAIACTMVITYIGTSFNQGAVPAGLVGRQYALIQQMEVITSQYRNQLSIANQLTNGTLDLGTFKANYIDGKPYVDSGNTYIKSINSSGNTYTTGNVLLVTLTNSMSSYTQTLQSIFTQ